MAEPLLAGAVQLTDSCALPEVRVGAAGASGPPALVLVVSDHVVPLPTELVAFTSTSYSVPLVTPVMTARPLSKAGLGLRITQLRFFAVSLSTV